MNKLIEHCKMAFDSYSGTYDSKYSLLWCGEIHHETISMLRDNNTIYVVITGSNDAFDWMRNFWAIKKHIGSDMYVHRGFHNGFKRVKNQIKNVLDLEEPDEVIFIGHSRGAAIAQIASWFFSQFYDVSCYTYASPRVGNEAFKDEINKKVPENYRVAIESDIVTTVPKINYKHAGILIPLPKQSGIAKSHSIYTYYNVLMQVYPD